jgi:hypothetical protein
LASANLQRRDVTLVIRTGGSSLTVAVKTVLESMFPDKVAAHDPCTSVAGGLAIANYYAPFLLRELAPAGVVAGTQQ